MKLSNLTVKYGKHISLNNLSIQLTNNGKIVGILGENGAGKTTLINVIIGRLNRFKGTRTVNESIAYMPDRFFLYENLRIKQAIKLFKQFYPDFDEKRALKILEHFNLNPNMKIHDGSKGNHEEIHLALILSRNTDFYVMDEPLSAIDPINRAAFIEAIENYRRKDSTVLIVTHLLRDLGSMFDEVILMRNGQLLLQDTKKNILTKYSSLEEAYFEEVGR
ncbi:ABC transporter ATP-binding protein [Lactobacillus sp. ESL0731]|uniref:ATP-binding cassette domain-containing protein n=1 Tax=unclassified Lactobacillus TaxID=2620435 RepID=UPI0023F6372A|nr:MULTISPECIES: ABC transporter ATP-binding protein [unclassified Lactobacillus]WEV50833.1 ABC transporter ATP-binding protein [Lactobacillus sp. ESL0700]WEV61964.1 ABC transporter ATP-binding protein [Lactobacillus sp. ESL0731]